MQGRRPTAASLIIFVAVMLVAMIIVTVCCIVVIMDRTIDVAFHLPNGYRGFFAVIVDPHRPAGVARVLQNGTWRNRRYDIAVEHDGLVIINEDHFLRSWHRSSAREHDDGNKNLVHTNRLFFTEGDMQSRNDGVRIYWMFYGDTADYNAHRNLTALEGRIAERVRLPEPRGED